MEFREESCSRRLCSIACECTFGKTDCPKRASSRSLDAILATPAGKWLAIIFAYNIFALSLDFHYSSARSYCCQIIQPNVKQCKIYSRSSLSPRIGNYLLKKMIIDIIWRDVGATFTMLSKVAYLKFHYSVFIKIQG